jgi:hypothetical protein
LGPFNKLVFAVRIRFPQSCGDIRKDLTPPQSLARLRTRGFHRVCRKERRAKREHMNESKASRKDGALMNAAEHRCGNVFRLNEQVDPPPVQGQGAPPVRPSPPLPKFT